MGMPLPPRAQGWLPSEALYSRDVLHILAESQKYLCPVERGEPTLLPGLETADYPFEFSSTARSLYVARKDGSAHTIILRYDIATRATAILKKLQPRDPAGVLDGGPDKITPDGRHYLASYSWHLSDLLLVEGIR